MQSTAKRKPSEAEQRRREFRVYKNSANDAADRQQQAAREKRRRRNQAKISGLMSVFCVFLMSMAYMVMTTQVTVVGYEINQRIADIDELRNENARLLLEIETATSPEKVASYAAEHFNMVSATEESVIYYDHTADASYGMSSNGMAIETAALGYGSVEVLEAGAEDKLTETFGTIWKMLAGTGGSNMQVGESAE